MTLTKSDLLAIRQIVKDETGPGLHKISTELNKWTKFLDKQDVKLEKRLERVEKELNLPTSNF